MPTLILVGDLDEKATRLAADAIAEGIRGARKVIFHAVAHMIPLELPDEFNRTVMSFLP